MYFTNIIKKIKKFDNKHVENYDLFTEIIRELQPIAFLISASLLLTVFFINFDENSVSVKYALLASVSFFLAYLGFVFYKIFNYRLSFYWGLSLTSISAILIYYSFNGVFPIFFSDTNNALTILVAYIVSSMFILMAHYTLGESNHNNNTYKISKYIFYLIVLFILIYIPIGVHFNQSGIPLLITILILFLISIVSVFNQD